MNDKDRQNYLVKFFKTNYEAETQQKTIIKGIPAKKISSRVVPRYNKKVITFHIRKLKKNHN